MNDDRRDSTCLPGPPLNLGGNEAMGGITFSGVPKRQGVKPRERYIFLSFRLSNPISKSWNHKNRISKNAISSSICLFFGFLELLKKNRALITAENTEKNPYCFARIPIPDYEADTPESQA